MDDLDRHMRSRQPAPQPLQKLQKALAQEWGWEEFRNNRIRRLIESMPIRVRAMLLAIVGHNRY